MSNSKGIESRNVTALREPATLLEMLLSSLLEEQRGNTDAQKRTIKITALLYMIFWHARQHYMRITSLLDASSGYQ